MINKLVSKQQLLETKFQNYLQNIINRKEVKLNSLDGEPPSLIDAEIGCSFSPRCSKPTENCKSGKSEMGLIEVADGHFADKCCVECG